MGAGDEIGDEKILVTRGRSEGGKGQKSLSRHDSTSGRKFATT